MINVLIVDDEQFSLDIINQYVDKVPFFNLVLATTSSIEASIVIQNQQIDLVFSDVFMPEMDGISLVKMIKGKSRVIFITAYSNYALEGYQNDVIDYLVKPLTFEDFFKAALKAEKIINFDKSESLVLSKNILNVDYIIIQTEHKGKYLKVKFNDIFFIEGKGNYVTIFMQNQEKIVIQNTFKNLEEKLPQEQFIRVNKSYIVNLQHVIGLDCNDILMDGGKVPIGRTYKDSVIEFFTINKL